MMPFFNDLEWPVTQIHRHAIIRRSVSQKRYKKVMELQWNTNKNGGQICQW